MISGFKRTNSLGSYLPRIFQAKVRKNGKKTLKKQQNLGAFLDDAHILLT
jgi:hypothetical protein